MTAGDAFANLSGVRNELAAAQAAANHALRDLGRDPAILGVAHREVKPSHLRACAERLEPTYVLRLFAEFEATLRSYLAFVRPRARPWRTRMELVMDRIAAVRTIPADVLVPAHDVRLRRNAIVHDRRWAVT